MNSIETELKNIMARRLGFEVEELVDDADIINDLGADSLDVVETIMDIEDAFDLEISDEVAAEKLRTVGDVIAYVKERCK